MWSDSTLNLLLPLFSLLLILVCVIYAYNYMQKGRKGIFQNKNVKEISRHYLSNKSYISIIKIVNEVYILGVSENNINKIDKVEDVDSISALLFDEKKETLSFKELLKNEAIKSKYSKIKKKIQKYEGNKNEKSE